MFLYFKVFEFVMNGVSNIILQETCSVMLILELSLARLISLLFLYILNISTGILLLVLI